MFGSRSTAWALASTLIACAAKQPPPPPPPPVEEKAPTSDPAVVALADEVDPGPQAPLFEALPAWLRARIGAAPDQQVATSEIREALMAWDKQQAKDGNELMLGLLRLGRGLVLAEQAVAAGSDDPELLLALARAYAILDNPAFANRQGMFQQILQFAGQLLQSQPPAEAVDAAALVDGLRTLLSRANALHLRTAAELLRRHSLHPEVPRVLGRLADEHLRRERFAEAVELRRMAIARLGTRATGGDHLDLASTCYRAFAFECGDPALAQGKALGGGKPDDAKATAAFATRVGRVEDVGGKARRAAALAADPKVADPKQPDLAPALERGHLLLLLDHYGDAQALYEQLRAAHPDDARPHAGLAKLAVQRGGDFATAGAQVEAARGKQRRDRDFYEVALGTAGMKLLTEVLPRVMQDANKVQGEMFLPVLDGLREYATGYAQYEPARAGVVLALEAVGRTALPRFAAKDDLAARDALRELQARSAALAQQYPDSADVRRLVYLAASFSSDGKGSIAAVREPLPPALAGDVALQRSRVQVWLDLTLLWEASAELPGLLAAAEALPVDPDDPVRPGTLATLLALQLRLGDRAAGERAAELFESLTGVGAASERAAATNNAGSLRAALGDPQTAVARYSSALELDPKALPALLNIAATVLLAEGGQRADLAGAFELVAKDGATTALRLQAQAWRQVQAQRGSGDVEVARADFAAALASERRGEVRGTTPLARWGVFNTGSVQLTLQYSVPSGLVIVNQIQSTEWFIEPAPGLDAMLAAAEKANKKKKPKKT
jgi:tetratricopeptide (TPR) repeat protein